MVHFEARMLTWVGRFLIAGSVVFLLGAAAGSYGLAHNAIYDCLAQPTPIGAREHEAGYAGHDTTVFPVAGIECRWNAVDGGVLSTHLPSIPLTVLGWGSFACGVGGAAALLLATLRPRLVS